MNIAISAYSVKLSGMKRDIYQQLKTWKSGKLRKPLILRGARQVGKTHALQRFAEEAYPSHIYINFETNKKVHSHFAESLEPEHIIKMLSIQHDIKIIPGETLLIFDEIQECPNALNSLKYFCEKANEYHVAAAGSLLGLKVGNKKGFPVGKVNFLDLYPLSFLEFLNAIGKHQYRNFIEEIKQPEPLPEALHSDLIDLLKHYIYLGGMPEVIANYIKDDDLNLAREVQLSILDAYYYDFAKHAPKEQVMKISAIWQQIPQQLAKENKKFIFSAIRKSARGREYEEAIQWLLDARLIYKSNLIETPKLPLKAYTKENAFKLFACDTGLVGALSELEAKTMIDGDVLFTEFNGALTENLVAQELTAYGLSPLYYWASEATAEVDFLIKILNKIFPFEVKAGNSNKKKSLLVYEKKYQPNLLTRTTKMNLKKDGNLINFPLYLLSSFREILESNKAEDLY